MIQRIFPYFLLVCFLGVGAAILHPTDIGMGRKNARRASCQSNLKQIGLALQQYANDYDGYLPPREWGAPLLAYAKSESVFQCPETDSTAETTDYFFNARFCGFPSPRISSLTTLILMGDGQDDAPFDATLSQLPAVWKKDESSPAWRHLDTANYAFADGHVRWLKANRISRDFRVVTP